MRGGALCLLLAAAPALATPSDTPARAPRLSDNPDVQCAAFWAGYGIAAARLTALGDDGLSEAAIRQYRDRAIAAGADADMLDRFIAAEADSRALMVEAYIYGGDETSREITLRTIERCPVE